MSQRVVRIAKPAIRIVMFLFVPIVAFHAHETSGETCSVTVAPLTFASVSPITRSAYTAAGSAQVTCTWGAASLVPNALVCLDLSATSLAMQNTGNALAYGLYTDSAYTAAWGASALGTTPLQVTLTKPLLGTTASATLPFYGKVTANQPTVPTQNNATTVYSQTLNGAQTGLRGYFYLLGTPACATITPTTIGNFAVTVTASVINSCTITASNVAFAAASSLATPLNATGSLTIACTNNDAYRIGLNGGSSGNVTARTMASNSGTVTATVAYQLYSDAARTVVWGDGSAGTGFYTAVGTGTTVTVPVYARTPAQTTPPPGTYLDTITATIAF